MKPFDVEAAKRGEAIVTRNGNPNVVFAGYNQEAQEGSQVAVWIKGKIVSFNENGHFWNDGTQHPLDLFMAPKKKELWVRVRRDVVNGLSVDFGPKGGLYYTIASGKWLTDPIKIEWEE